MKEINGREVRFSSIEEVLNSRISPEVTPIYKYSIICAYSVVSIMNNNGNCKSAYVSNLGSTLAGRSEDKKQEVLKAVENILSRRLSKLIFTTTFISKELVDYVANYFPLAYCVEIPIGYGEGVQYHCGFLTNNETYGRYDRYLERVENNKSIPTRGMAEIGITSEIKEKILGYKRKYYLEKYLNKLIS